YILDTDLGSIVSGTMQAIQVVRAAGTGVHDGTGFYLLADGTTSVLSATSITVEGTLRIIGGRAIIILPGDLAGGPGPGDAGSGSCTGFDSQRFCAGPGAGMGGHGNTDPTGMGIGGSGNAGDGDKTGGGGAGYGTGGAGGGAGTGGETAGAAGVAYGNVS